MAELNDKKYLDLTGLSHFWGKTKTYIDTQDAAVTAAASQALSDAISPINESINGINEKLNALSVNGKTFSDNKIVLGASDIEYAAAGEGTEAVSVADAIAANTEAIEANAEAIGKKISSVDASTDAAEGEESKILVSLSSTTTEGAVKITLDESALQDKLSTIEAAAGVATLKVEGQNGDGVASSLIAVAITEGDVQTDGSSYKGDVTITIDEAALQEKFGSVEDAISDNAEAIAANAEAIAANAEAITNLTSSTITSVGEAADSVEDYVSLDVATENNGVTLKLDDSKLSDKFDEVDGDIAYLKGLTINGVSAYTTGVDGVKSSAVTIGAGDISYKTGVTVEAAIAANEEAIAALASATHFVGVSSTPITDGGTEKATIDGKEHTAQDGDIVIYTKDEFQGEFIWSNGAWYLLGDTTAELARISALEGWVTGNAISTNEIDALFAEGEGGEATE